MSHRDSGDYFLVNLFRSVEGWNFRVVGPGIGDPHFAMPGISPQEVLTLFQEAVSLRGQGSQ